MQHKYDYGDAVRLIRNVRNDGTYPGEDMGTLLIRRGTIGHVVNIGTFLQDQIIYTVHFVEENKMVGCREEELIPAEAPWNPSKFEFRDKVVSKLSLAINGEVIVEEGALGDVERVLQEETPIQYHIRFPGRTLQVPESALDEAPADHPDLVSRQKDEDH